jgi:molybdenum cofactor guanylyltransferase
VTTRRPDVSALILAGGKATRLGGIAKHEIVVDGEPIFARQVRVLAPRVTEILVSGPAIDGHVRDVLERASVGYRGVQDAVQGAGPLAGIAAGLAACRTPWLLVLAGDMPHVTGELIDALIEKISPTHFSAATEKTSPTHVSDELDAVGVRVNGLPEPLLSVLNVRVLAVIERALKAGRFKASRILTDEGLRVEWLEADPEAVRNINSPEDLRETTGSK